MQLLHTQRRGKPTVAPPRDAAFVRVHGSAEQIAVTSPALGGRRQPVDVYLPPGYNAHPDRRYAVLYLLHGTSGGADDWTSKGGAEQATAGKPLIVVMPDIALNRNGFSPQNLA